MGLHDRPIELHVCAGDPDGAGESRREAALVWVDDADALHAERRRAGVAHEAAGTVPSLAAPADTPHGVRTFLVTDPAGNRIRFGSGPH